MKCVRAHPETEDYLPCQEEPFGFKASSQYTGKSLTGDYEPSNSWLGLTALLVGLEVQFWVWLQDTPFPSPQGRIGQQISPILVTLYNLCISIFPWTCLQLWSYQVVQLNGCLGVVNWIYWVLTTASKYSNHGFQTRWECGLICRPTVPIWSTTCWWVSEAARCEFTGNCNRHQTCSKSNDPSKARGYYKHSKHYWIYCWSSTTCIQYQQIRCNCSNL